jgi:uridine kinase
MGNKNNEIVNKAINKLKNKSNNRKTNKEDGKNKGQNKKVKINKKIQKTIVINKKLDNLNNLILELIKKGKRIFIFAGPSSSGKTFIAKNIVNYLNNNKKEAVLISLDNFYKRHSIIYSILYGSFDHIRLFDIRYLNKFLNDLIKKGEAYLPIYSFEEKDRVSYEKIKINKDTIIVIEGLYPFKMINKKFLNKKEVVKFFVNSKEDELLIRRIIRDPERTKEPLNNVIEILTSVFPFWKIFGENQKYLADFIIFNNFKILNQFEKKKELINNKQFEKLKKKYNYKVFLVYDYIYNNNKKIVIREYYPFGSDLIDSYSLIVEEKDKYYEIKLRYPGKISKLHLLIQNLGINFEKIEKKLIFLFRENEKPIFEVEVKKDEGKTTYIKKEF